MHTSRDKVLEMSAKPLRRATYADIEALPEHQVGEIIGDRLYVFPRPATPHAAASSALGEILGAPFKRGRGGPGGWFILDEPELHFGSDVLVPDLAGWRRDRVPEIPAAPFLSIGPDWVCEVLSPSTAAVDRGEKLPVFARERVAHVWFVDPIAKTLEVLRLDGESYRVVTTHHGGAVAKVEPFDAIDLELAILWAR